MGVVEGGFGKCCVPLKKFWLCYAHRNADKSKTAPFPKIRRVTPARPCVSLHKQDGYRYSCMGTYIVGKGGVGFFGPWDFFQRRTDCRSSCFYCSCAARHQEVKPGCFKLLSNCFQNSLTNSLHCYVECYRR